MAPKPDEDSTGARRRIPRPAALIASACIVFAILAVALMQALPAPRSKADYLIVGTLATLAALITIFAGLLLGRRSRL